jgi:hypothetical protein
MSERMFPVLWQGGRDYHKALERLGCPREIPWSQVAPHERQAMRNHGRQTLKELADRGGLSPEELLAVLEDRRFESMPIELAVAQLLELVSK